MEKDRRQLASDLCLLSSDRCREEKVLRRLSSDVCQLASDLGRLDEDLFLSAMDRDESAMDLFQMAKDLFIESKDLLALDAAGDVLGPAGREESLRVSQAPVVKTYESRFPE